MKQKKNSKILCSNFSNKMHENAWNMWLNGKGKGYKRLTSAWGQKLWRDLWKKTTKNL